METINASVEKIEEKYFIKVEIGAEGVRIPMSEDQPNDVKSAFNKIITRMKDGVFQIALVEAGGDLFSQVALEYITQLNREISAVHGEMQQHGLVTIAE